MREDPCATFECSLGHDLCVLVSGVGGREPRTISLNLKDNSKIEVRRL